VAIDAIPAGHHSVQQCCWWNIVSINVNALLEVAGICDLVAKWLNLLKTL